MFRVKKLGVDKARLHDISGLKKSVFDKLTASMVTLRKEIQPEQEKKVKSTKRSHTFVESVEARAMGNLVVYINVFSFFLLFTLSF